MSNTRLRWVDEMPNRYGESMRDPSWKQRLSPLLARPGEPARVWRMKNEASASSTVSQLRHRQLAIPYPDALWEFTWDGADIYACYRGEAITD